MLQAHFLFVTFKFKITFTLYKHFLTIKTLINIVK
jgi:hypothetical protein